MKVSEEIKRRLLKILESGVLNIRYLINKGEYKYCLVEADHIHNLPGLIENFSQELLNYYLDVEVDQYLRDMGSNVSLNFRENLKFIIENRRVI